MKKLMVIDDDKLVLHTIKTVLERARYIVVATTDARRALVDGDLSTYDAVVIDIFMPDLDGIETMTVIHKTHPYLPIIIISGHEFSHGACRAPDFLTMATKLGAYASLAKPFTPSALLTIVGRAVEAKIMPDKRS